MNLSLHIFAVTLLFVGCFAGEADPNSTRELARCIRMAEPLVYNKENVFPLNQNEVRAVCKMWGEFQGCVRNFTSVYLNVGQRTMFYNAIQPSLDSIIRLCDEKGEFYRDYLDFAPCMKKISTNDAYCGDHYNYMAQLITGSDIGTKVLCCSLSKFRTCVTREIPRECDDRGKTVSAVEFVNTMLDRAFSFLLQDCKDYKPSSEDCPGNEYVDGGGKTQFGDNSNAFNDEGNSVNFGGFIPDLQSSTDKTPKFTWTIPSDSATSQNPWNLNNLNGNSIDGPQPFVDNPGGSASSLKSFLSVTLCLILSLVLFS